MIEKRSTWWKVYFWLCFIFVCLFFVKSFYENNIFLESNIFSNMYIGLIYVIYSISLLGIWGFVYQKRVFYQEFWRYIFFIIIFEIIGSYLTKATIESSTPEKHSSTILLEPLLVLGMWFILLLGLILIFFYFYALYQYAFKMKYLWREDD